MTLLRTSTIWRRATIAALVVVAVLGAVLAAMLLDQTSAAHESRGAGQTTIGLHQWGAESPSTTGSAHGSDGNAVAAPPVTPTTPPASAPAPGVAGAPAVPGVQDAPAGPPQTIDSTEPDPQLGEIGKRVAFTIAGDLAGALAPGVGAPLELRLRNLGDHDIAVTHLAVRIAPGTGRPGCDVTLNFRVRQISARHLPLVLPARATRTLTQLGVDADAKPRVAMLNLPVNQDACKGAVLTFEYTGRAR